MPKPTSIPLWELNEMSVHHFGTPRSDLHSSSFEHLFHINKLEAYQSKIQFPLPPHRKQVYDFLFITKGVTRRSKALNPYEIGENTFFFLPAYQITNHEFMSEDIEGYFCHFNMDIFTNHLPQHNILRDFPFLQFVGNPMVSVDAAVKPFVLNILNRLEAESKKENIVTFDIVTVYLLSLFTEVNRFYTPSVSMKKNTALMITQNFKDALSRHIYEKQKVMEYANLLNISPNHLNKCVKTTTGQSAQDLLNEMVLLEAKVLLKQTDMQISEIAYKLSQQNHSDFSRFFKLKTGFSPKEYKQNS
ncbi:MAG: helix-turn-helix domain-containing protein [Saprospiraceae bacterium]|nr:helix-turn-helix domain-containing protein [Saprospiraceae bacterium]